MGAFLKAVDDTSTWIWGGPMLYLLCFGGFYLSLRLGFFQIRYASYIFKQTVGSVFAKRDKGEGSISPFQAATAALASTIGAANIIGVPAAICFGGPGAVFWMWIIAIFGMAVKFSEIVLSYRYREKNTKAEYVGGPMYYMSKGLKLKWLGMLYSFFLMIEIIPSVMIQSHSVTVSIKESLNIKPEVTGLFLTIFIGIVVIGGIKRIGKVTEKIVPLMSGLYIAASLLIIMLNYEKLPDCFSFIFSYAFQPMAAVGGFAGSTLATTIRWGVSRGIHSSEIGMGTASIAHSAAINDHAVRQGFWAIFEIAIDTLIICSMTAFVILSSGLWIGAEANQNPASLPVAAFNHYLGPWGGIALTASLLSFVVSTIIVIIFYGEKQAEFLLGGTFSKVMRYAYIISLFIGSIGCSSILWHFLDLLLALVVVPNMIAILCLHNEVVMLVKEFFTSDHYYLKDINNNTVDTFRQR